MQGTLATPVLFTLHLSDFQYNSELCGVQKIADNTTAVGWIKNEQEKYREEIISPPLDTL